MHLSKAHSKIYQECYNICKNVTVQKTFWIIIVPNNIKIQLHLRSQNFANIAFTIRLYLLSSHLQKYFKISKFVSSVVKIS